MKIKDIRVVKINFPVHEPKTPYRHEGWGLQDEVANRCRATPGQTPPQPVAAEVRGRLCPVTAENDAWAWPALACRASCADHRSF